MKSTGYEHSTSTIGQHHVKKSLSKNLKSFSDDNKELLIPIEKTNDGEYLNNTSGAESTAIPTGQMVEKNGKKYELFLSASNNLSLLETEVPPSLPGGYQYVECGVSSGKVLYQLTGPKELPSSEQIKALQGISSFQGEQSGKVNGSVVQGQMNTSVVKNVESRQFLQHALLQTNFNKEIKSEEKIITQVLMDTQSSMRSSGGEHAQNEQPTAEKEALPIPVPIIRKRIEHSFLLSHEETSETQEPNLKLYDQIFSQKPSVVGGTYFEALTSIQEETDHGKKPEHSLPKKKEQPSFGVMLSNSELDKSTQEEWDKKYGQFLNLEINSNLDSTANDSEAKEPNRKTSKPLQTTESVPKKAPEQPKNQVEHDAAIRESEYAIRDIPNEEKTPSETKRWLEINPNIAREYHNFSQEAKEDPEITLQALKVGAPFNKKLSDIPSTLHENEEVIVALINQVVDVDEAYQQLSSKMKSKPSVRKSVFERKRKRYSFRIQREYERKKSFSVMPSSDHEKALPVMHFPKEIRSLLRENIDGSWSEGIISPASKDALITDTEVVLAIEKLLEKDEPTQKDIETLQSFDQIYEELRRDGVVFRVAGTGNPYAEETTPVRKFDEARIQQLGELVSEEIDPYQRVKAQETVDRANAANTKLKDIPDAQKLAVFGYTTSDYKQLNKALRSGNISEEQQLYIDGISEGLRQLPSHKGIVWRKTILPQEIADKYVPGQKIVEKAFTSTSYGEHAAFGGDVTFCIQLKDEGSAGKKVDHLSAYATEQEVLINAGTQFKVLANELINESKTPSGQDVHIRYIYLQEI